MDTDLELERAVVFDRQRRVLEAMCLQPSTALGLPFDGPLAPYAEAWDAICREEAARARRNEPTVDVLLRGVSP